VALYANHAPLGPHQSIDHETVEQLGSGLSGRFDQQRVENGPARQ
jgi:hypothetical protein